MRISVFGLSISSAWGNGHATLLRGLFKVLHAHGHSIDFFERNTEYYSAHRDATEFPFVNLHFYDEWASNLPLFRRCLKEADVGIVTSYCPDGAAACKLLLDEPSQLRRVFYDMDTPVTLERLKRGEDVGYVPPCGLSDFDLVLSYTGGTSISQLRELLGARRVATLYGWVDPDLYRQVPIEPRFNSHLSYLGTYAADRQEKLEALLFSPASEMKGKQFLVAGAMYPKPEQWPKNVRHLSHVSPPEHAAFYSSSPLTLNVTRGAMATMGYCPSGRLFESAACGTAVLSDWWEGLDYFFEPRREILIANSTHEAVWELLRDASELEAIGTRARARTMACHTAAIRAERLVRLIEDPFDDVEGGSPEPFAKNQLTGAMAAENL